MESASWRTTWQKLLVRAWIPALAVVVAIAVWKVFQIVPVWLEETVTRSLREEEVVVTAFPFEHVGLNRTRIGEGSLLFRESSLSWDSIHLDYQTTGLIRGRVDHVEVQSPLIRFDWDVPAGAATRLTVPVHAAGDPAEDDFIDPQDVRIGGDSPAGDLAQDETTAAAGEPAQVWQNPWAMLQDLPVNSFAARDGVLKIQLQELFHFAADFEGRVERQPFGISGEWFLDSPEISLHASLRAPADEQLVTLQGESAMPAGALRDLANRFFSIMENCGAYPVITQSGQLVLDFLAEKKGDAFFHASAETSIAELMFLVPGTGMEIGLTDLVLAGFFKDEQFNMEGGTGIFLPPGDDVFVEPFGMRFSLKDSVRFSVETEVIDWRWDKLSGRCAILGTGDSRRFPGPGWARMETAFSMFKYGGISLEPFSVLLTPGQDRISLECSPVGIQQSGTIWVEEISGSVTTAMDQGSGGFKWYGLLGEELGGVELEMLKSGQGTHFNYAVLGADGQQGIRGGLDRGDDKLSIELSGQLLLPWINTLAQWFGYSTSSLRGGHPEIELRLDWSSPILSGTGRVALDGMDLVTPDGPSMEGISGTTDFSVMVMPKTIGRQLTRINRLTSGPVVIRDIEIEWELKHIRELSVTRFTGRIGDGFIELEPFSMDPLQPELETAIIVRKFDADLLRQWLNEDRFSIHGYITGNIPVGWKNGEVVVGSGTFELDTQTENGRLKFEDEQFLQEKFASIGGIPMDLKERLLDALWKNGIQMNWMEVYLGPTDKDGELSFRISVNGETGNELLEFPIGGFVINNLISLSDLAVLMNMVAPIRIDPGLGNR